MLLWWLENPSLLSQEARNIIQEPSNIVFVSSVSTWEIAIKRSLGKLKAPSRIIDFVFSQNFQELPITIAHTQELEALPSVHHDPFDRLLIAQAISEGTPILTRDTIFAKYPVSIITA